MRALLAFRARWSGTIQDIAGGVSIVGFLVVFLAYAADFAR